jgi:hypothetical protein
VTVTGRRTWSGERSTGAIVDALDESSAIGYLTACSFPSPPRISRQPIWDFCCKHPDRPQEIELTFGKAFVC